MSSTVIAPEVTLPEPMTQTPANPPMNNPVGSRQEAAGVQGVSLPEGLVAAAPVVAAAPLPAAPAPAAPVPEAPVVAQAPVAEPPLAAPQIATSEVSSTPVSQATLTSAASEAVIAAPAAPLPAAPLPAATLTAPPLPQQVTNEVGTKEDAVVSAAAPTAGFASLPEDVLNQPLATASQIVKGPMMKKIFYAFPASPAPAHAGDQMIFDASAYKESLSGALGMLNVKGASINMISKTDADHGLSRYELAVAWDNPAVTHERMSDAMNIVLAGTVKNRQVDAGWESHFVPEKESVAYQLDSIARSQAQNQTQGGHVPQPGARMGIPVGVPPVGPFTEQLQAKQDAQLKAPAPTGAVLG